MSKASKYLKLKNFREKQFESHLSNLKPVGRVDLQGLSLVAKFSPNFPELILTCDESGYGYLINSLELEMKKEKGLIAPFNLLPKSIIIKNLFFLFHLNAKKNINVMIMEQFLILNGTMNRENF